MCKLFANRMRQYRPSALARRCRSKMPGVWLRVT
jgi:hypothetical protein